MTIPAPVKPVHWMGSSRADLKSFPEAVQDQAGHELFQVQCGRQPANSKPMTTVGGGVYEIRIHTATEHRLLYIAKFAEAIYVLHAFEKRTRKTSRQDIQLARRRFAQVIAQRRSG